MIQKFKTIVAVSIHITIALLIKSTASLRNPLSDSILDIINTKEVERLIAERQENASLHEKQYLEENGLDEDTYLINSQQEVFLPQPDEEPVTFSSIKHGRNRNRIKVEVLLKHNSTDPYQSAELLSEYTGMNGRKVLKSSKNALLVTKKEYLKKDWCKSEPLVQRIKEDGCLTRTIINKFCYGQCNSFFIPKNPKRRNSKRYDDDDDVNSAAFKSCSFCKPKKFTWMTVTLKCPGLYPPFRRKRVQRIKQCKCIAQPLN